MFIMLFIVLWAMFGFPNFFSEIDASNPNTWNGWYNLMVFVIILQLVRFLFKKAR